MKDKLLFTPGPLTTSSTVKEAALHDLGSRDFSFINTVRHIRERLLSLAHVQSPDYETVIMQGSGTFGVESVISSVIPAKGLLLNIVNGAYGRRISQMSKVHSFNTIELEYPENTLPDLFEIEKVLDEHPEISHVAIVHGETTTGLLNPVNEVGEITARHGKSFIVDAMSTFGAYDLDMKSCNISFLISSSNKCIEGIPGFSFVLAKRDKLEACKNQARTLSLDLYDQWKGLESNGQFRFTPPVQVLLAFNKALDELDNEGGITGRAERYRKNNQLLVKGMRDLGFRLYLTDEIRSYIITSFLYPEHQNFSFDEFYKKLNDKGFVIYPGKLSKVDCFRIGNIGRLSGSDISMLLQAVREVMIDMELTVATN